ncbi:MAG TPA: hypothetical protein VFU47_07990, partial [Armatimonadota bacterium]|nr:hypothetical protein [Armatimonadota bacterium]
MRALAGLAVPASLLLLTAIAPPSLALQKPAAPRLGGLTGPLAGLFTAVARTGGRIVPGSTKPEKVAEGCAFTEGPAADARGNVYFSDAPNNRIM